MMVELEHVTKCYPRKVAVNNISFSVDTGEIVGVLGPNGAGKTTTMRMISGYVPPTGGNIRVAEHDVMKDPVGVRRRIGYMPENVPLYGEMRIDEFLRFRANLKGVSRKRCKARIGEVKEMCGLKDEGRRIIGQLSKGYRQRVGLADALVHNPDLLILDEPTIGLDPNQIRSVRELIQQLAEQHTIILCTHILSEVEMTCQRVLIIKEGQIVASDTPGALRAMMQGGTRVVAELHAPPDEARDALASLPHVREVVSDRKESWTHYEVVCATDVDLRPNVFELVVRKGWKLRELSLNKTSLEDAFVRLTGEESSSKEEQAE